MPARPLLDFDRVDLSRVVATRDDVLLLLKQRGRFAMLDGVLYRGTEDDLIVGYKDIRADDWWTVDHVPGRPIFPGALMIETGAQLCTYDFLLREVDVGDRFIGFGGLNNTRFRNIVEPDCRMIFVGKLHKIRRGTFTYFSQGYVDRNLVFEMEVLGVAI